MMGDTNDGKGVELYINCKTTLAPNFWTNYQYTVDTTCHALLRKPTKFTTIIMKISVTQMNIMQSRKTCLFLYK